MSVTQRPTNRVQNPNWQYPCDDIMSIDDPVQSIPFTVIPDAQTHTLTLSGSPVRVGAVIQIYNSNGQLILEEISDSENTVRLNFVGATGGIYFVTVTGEKGRVSEKFWVVGE